MGGEWRSLCLAELCELRAGAVFKPALQGQASGRYPFVKVSDMNLPENAVRMHVANNWVSEGDLRQLRAKPFPPGTVVFAKIGEALRQNRLRQLVRETLIDNNMMGAIPRTSVVDPRFFYYALSQFDFFDIAQGTALPYLTVSSLSALSIRCPPLSEQRAIAHILGTLDDKIELNRKMNQTLEAMARALFKSWFIDFDPVRAKAEGRQPAGMDAETAALFPDGFEDSELGPIPRGWRASTVGQEFNLKMGQSPPGSTYNEAGDGLPFFQGRRDFGFRFPKRRVYCTDPTRIADPGDTLVTVRAPVGSLNMAKERCCVGRGIAAVRHKSGARSFTYYSMASLGAAFARFEDQGTVFGSLNKGAFNSLHVISPHSVIIDRFEYLVGSMDERIKQLSDESDVLAALRDTLLPKLISGEIRVRDAERLVEGVAGSEAIGHDDARKGEAA